MQGGVCVFLQLASCNTFLAALSASLRLCVRLSTISGLNYDPESRIICAVRGACPLEKQKEKSMKKYVCKVCGHVYDPAENNGVAFEDLPDDWACPVCGVGKDQFEEA